MNYSRIDIQSRANADNDLHCENKISRSMQRIRRRIRNRIRTSRSSNMSTGHPKFKVRSYPIPARVSGLPFVHSPELKKEEWSVYVLDPSEDKWSGNGTITSVIKDDESTPIVGKVKKKFRRETLEVELRLVKVIVMTMSH